jgi:uncharacterized protein (DUF58 family)
VRDRQKYLDPRILAKLRGLPLRARHIVEGYVAGLHRSPSRGFSIEFAEHREYAPGDDLRYVDWKVFGRTDKFYLKQYEDETNLICYIVLDISESMSYRSGQAALSKLEYAQCVAGSLAYLVLHQQDAVGLVTFDQEIQALVRPSTNPSHLGQVMSALESVSAESKTEMGLILHDVAERFAKRGVVLILSDLFDDVPSILAGLKHLRHRRHDVIVFHLLDPAELDFPFTRPTRFLGLEQGPEVATDPTALRAAYLHEFRRFLGHIERGCRSQQVDYQRIRTDQLLDAALSRYLAARMAKVN